MKGRSAGIGILLLLVVGIVYYKSPVHYCYDSTYSLLMDEAILQHGTPDMTAYTVGHGLGVNFFNRGYFYTLDLIDGRLLYIFPWGAAFLALPSVAVFNAAGIKVAPSGIYNGANELKMQTIIAGVVCAAIVWIFYQTANLLLSTPWALGIALGAAFATPIWSTASRSLWAQTWYLFFISLVGWVLLKGRPRPVLLGTLLAWAWFVRAETLPAIVLISIYALSELDWRRVYLLLFTEAAWAAAMAWLMARFFGAILSPSERAGTVFGFGAASVRLLGLLFSPSRGLIVFVPIVLLPLYFAVRYWAVFPRKRLALLAIAVIVAHIVTTAFWGGSWWGGWSYGPRLLIETVPWFVLLTILGLRAFLDHSEENYKRLSVIGAATALLLVSVTINAIGACSQEANDWNGKPNIDQYQTRLWDWRHPQFLPWLKSPELLPGPNVLHERARRAREGRGVH